MLLHFEEYALQNSSYSKVLSYYNKLPTMLHEMSADDVLKETNRNGSKSFYQQKAAISNYLLWLSNTYSVDVNDLYYGLCQNDNKKSFKFVGFFDFQDLQKSIIDAENW